MGAKVVISASQGDDSLPAATVFSVLWNGIRELGHGAVLHESDPKTVCTVLESQEKPHCRPSTGNRNTYSAGFNKRVADGI